MSIIGWVYQIFIPKRYVLFCFLFFSQKRGYYQYHTDYLPRTHLITTAGSGGAATAGPLQGQGACFRFHGRPRLVDQLDPALGYLYVVRRRRHNAEHIVLVVLIAILLVLPERTEIVRLLTPLVLELRIKAESWPITGSGQWLQLASGLLSGFHIAESIAAWHISRLPHKEVSKYFPLLQSPGLSAGLQKN